jgi:beta-xylosidase
MLKNNNYKDSLKNFIKEHIEKFGHQKQHTIHYYKFYKATYFINCINGYNKKYEKVMDHIFNDIYCVGCKKDARDLNEQLTLRHIIMKPRFRNYMKAAKLKMKGKQK